MEQQMVMTATHTEICEKLRLYGRVYGWRTLLEADDLIEDQAARIQQQALEYMSLFDQCSEGVARVAELEAKCSMLEKAREQDPICVKWYADRFDKDQDRIDELQAQLERSNRLLAEVAALKRYDANAKKGYTAGLWITLSVPGNLLERIDAAISANKGEQE